MARFFAATELKAMLAHIQTNYDVKSATDGVRPLDDEFGLMSAPAGTARFGFGKGSNSVNSVEYRCSLVQAVRIFCVCFRLGLELVSLEAVKRFFYGKREHV
jgi:hypothetical protein